MIARILLLLAVIAALATAQWGYGGMPYGGYGYGRPMMGYGRPYGGYGYRPYGMGMMGGWGK